MERNDDSCLAGFEELGEELVVVCSSRLVVPLGLAGPVVRVEYILHLLPFECLLEEAREFAIVDGRRVVGSWEELWRRVAVILSEELDGSALQLGPLGDAVSVRVGAPKGPPRDILGHSLCCQGILIVSDFRLVRCQNLGMCVELPLLYGSGSGLAFDFYYDSIIRDAPGFDGDSNLFSTRGFQVHIRASSDRWNWIVKLLEVPLIFDISDKDQQPVLALVRIVVFSVNVHPDRFIPIRDVELSGFVVGFVISCKGKSLCHTDVVDWRWGDSFNVILCKEPPVAIWDLVVKV
ncbi:hypothetical protein NUU61_003802 [Penicillium alfredii]|uniref:Uncharacterized protein n=1 Tax=Penicillium alfredii TaxID=1506179 RepID=A0A9W9KCQ1_9EURO|nr:uncharacterized protein NUU61_003802 [Penicillium alfredii]KAJ5101580.1 hypothetical protein NUU61_003802 [Penicillium alfredii]